MRFTTFLWLSVALAVAFAAINWLGLAGWLAAIVVLGSIGMHVAGNAIGTRMQEATDRDLARRGGRFRSAPVPALPPTHLERRTRVGWLLPVSAGIGGVVGGVAGGTALATLASASLPGALLGGISSAVLGGLFGFLIASFIDILRTSVREALEAERQGSKRLP
jgi:predicted DNA repair protein MutK